MKVAALDPGALLARLRRVPAAPSPRLPSGACVPLASVPPRGAGGRPPRLVPAAVEREPEGRAGAKGPLIALPDIGEEVAAESDGEEAACSAAR